jgi:hypothetical protein
MKKTVAICLFILSILWTLMALFKLYLGLTGYVDWSGRGPSAHFMSGMLQLILAGIAYWIAQRLRRNEKAKSITASRQQGE